MITDDLSSALLQVFDPNNPYLRADEQYASQMKNLSWLLGTPLEIFVRIDGRLQINEQKDDLMKDSIMQAMFYGSVHVEIALDLLSRFEPGLTECISRVDMRVAAGEVDLQSKTGNKRAAKAKTNNVSPPKAAAAPKKAANKKRPAPASPHARPRQQRKPQASSPSVASANLQVNHYSRECCVLLCLLVNAYSLLQDCLQHSAAVYNRLHLLNVIPSVWDAFLCCI